MNCKTLVSNIIALVIVVITITVNLLIEMVTGVIDGHPRLRKFFQAGDDNGQFERSTGYRYDPSIFQGYFAVMAYLCIGSMLFLLVISLSAAVAIPSMKKVLESKYQVKRKALVSKEPTTLVELKQHVSKYWIMANTGSLPVVFTSGPLFATSLCICIVCSVTYVILRSRRDPFGEKYASDYKWSMRVIFVVQSLGIAAGDCTLILRYYKSSKIFRNYCSCTRVEKFWYAKLSEWKGRHIRLPAAADLIAETVVHTVRGTFLNLLIMFQFVFVLIYKLLGSASLKIINFVFKMIRSRPIASSGNEDLRNYALCVGGDIKLYRYAMHYLKESMDGLVKKAEKKQNKELLELLGKSNGFKEGQNFAIGQVQIPLSVELKSWSLPVITLTCIAIVLPDSQKQIDRLIKSVDQALEYTHLVEKGFHSEDEYANMHKKTMDFWYEVKANRKWLETSLKRKAFKGKTPTEILKWFDDKAKEAIGPSKSTVVDVEVEPLENYPDLKLMICNSMRSISSSILSKYENRSQLSTKVDFFELLSSMIADILFACFSNIPQVITRKCHVEEIEKREASVEAAVKILARTTKILEMFGTPKLPVLDQREMASVDKWRHPLIQPPTDPAELSAV
ncbi:hypothetical protein CTI12_AA508940 [Artemisia annua]|uniref:Uncharacterized protein n=1 Tax=Artemisia annua TaxID=35608 RepID=A0A2U1LBQ6_ARTAN|nr:hypothetical protein CTI12_AA508940 [Artemisia annua]